MEKVYLRNDKNLKLADVICIFPTLCRSIKENKENTQKKLSKILIDTYINNIFKNAPELALEVANKLQIEGIEVDVEYMKNELVVVGIMTLKIIEKLPINYKKEEEKIEKALENAYIFDKIFEYLELNTKKIIISELLKRVYYKMYSNIKFKIKITDDKLEEIFGGSISNKRSFFTQQFNLWAMYNKIIQFVSIEECEDHMLITFNVLI